MKKCPSPSIPQPSGYKPAPPSCGCGCGSKGNCNGFIRRRGRDQACCDNSVTREIVNVPQDVDACPPGFVWSGPPEIVVEARNNPVFSTLFACLDDETLYSYLCCMGQYDLPGCGHTPVLLAAAHWYTLATAGQRLGTGVMVTQSQKGVPLEMIAGMQNNMDPDRHWMLSFYGIQYSSMFMKPVKTMLSMAWGI